MKKQLVAVIGMMALGGGATAAPILWDSAAGGNGHYYEFISTAVDWNAALAGAAASSHLGLSGYLATVTSANEQAFVFGNVTRSLSWISGSDRDNEGVWRWMSGPEAGQIFFGAGAPVGAYSNWGGGEPNNCCGGENYLQFAWVSDGGWNDHGGPGNPGQLNGYIVEYSGDPTQVPLPASWALFGLGAAVGIRKTARKS